MINIVCALHCEAKPLIVHFKLSKAIDAIYPLFLSQEFSSQGIRLVVSGVGRVATASAIAYLFTKMGEEKNQAWLNYGIAGHKSAPIASWFNVNKITEPLTGVSWYPARFPREEIKVSRLMTVDVPCSSYEDDLLYDMEASAFMATALKFTSTELIQVMKLISDNENSSIKQINKNQVKALFDENLDLLLSCIQTLQKEQAAFIDIYDTDALYLDCQKRWHFTAYQTNELERLIQRWRLMLDDTEISELHSCQNSKQVILWFKKQINNAPVNFS